VVASLPDADELNAEQPRRLIHNDTISAAVAPALDRSAAWLRAIEPRIVNAVKPLRVLADLYNSVGLRQTWNMFSNPVTADQYVRVDHYVESTASPQPVHVFRELALPAQRQDQVRLVHKFRDKAVLNALEAFSIARAHGEENNQPPPRDLQPLVRYFRNRFERDYLKADERIVRTDVWYGQAAIPPPGARLTPEQRESRLAALATYWHGASEIPASIPLKPGALQREDAIVWRLEYIDQP
jgi:hypothetical protein